MASFDVKLVKRSEVALGTMVFEFEKPAGFEFKPGQFIDMTLINPPYTDQKGPNRDFSIASSPREPNLMVAMRMRNTAFKNFLKEAPLGTKVQIKGPFGSLTLPEDVSRRAVLLSGGIGITPFRSLVRHAAYKRLPDKIVLFYSNRRPEAAPFLDEFAEMEEENSNFKLIATMTKPETSRVEWGGEIGYINAVMIKKYIDNPFEAIYYIAGPPAFVQGMWQMLKLSGVSGDNIKTEEFAGY